MYRFQNGFKAPVNVVILKTNDAVSACLQPFSACGIVFGLIRIGVRITINFDKEFGFGAIEICNKTE